VSTHVASISRAHVLVGVLCISCGGLGRVPPQRRDPAMNIPTLPQTHFPNCPTFSWSPGSLFAPNPYSELFDSSDPLMLPQLLHVVIISSLVPALSHLVPFCPGTVPGHMNPSTLSHKYFVACPACPAPRRGRDTGRDTSGTA